MNRLYPRRLRAVTVCYFSARVRGEASARRQSVYLDALAAHCPLLEIHEGRFQEKRSTCRQCGAVHRSFEEKETDVSIAVALVEDAVLDRYDTALLLSADSDLCPAVRSVRRVAPAKRIIVAFPPRRVSVDLGRTAHGSFTLPDSKIRNNLLPDAVPGDDGALLRRPKHWR